VKRPICIFLAALSASVCYGDIIEVPSDQPTIQSGINAATTGDTVLVSPGTYFETIDLHGLGIVVASLYLTTDDPSYVPSTVIDGDSAGSVVSFVSGESSNAAITGFTIQHGYSDWGGGIISQGASPVIDHNILRYNHAVENGGGIHCAGASAPTISYNEIHDNSAGTDGAGIDCYLANAMISDNNIHHNTASSAGAIHCGYATGPQIIGNTLSDNVVTNCGGAIALFDSNPIISGNTFADNHADNCGGAMQFAYCTGPQVSGNTIHSNTAGNDGGAISLFDSDPVISNNEISENEVLTGNGWGGGAIFASYSDPDITGNSFQANLSANRGGAIALFESQGTYGGNSITENTALSMGGGYYCEKSDPQISYDTLTNNVALFGAGVCCSVQCSPMIESCIFAEDSAGTGGAIYLYYADSPTVAGCTFERCSASRGGAVYCRSAENLVIENSSFQENTAFRSSYWDGDGGGMYCEQSNVTLVDNVFAGNISGGYNGAGGGIYVTGLSDVLFDRNAFLNNQADRGGGLVCYDSYASLRDCEFSHNTGFLFAGGFANWDSEVEIVHCQFLHNDANLGGGFYSEYGSYNDVTIDSCIFAHNTAVIDGGGVYLNDFETSYEMSNCMLIGNTAGNHGGGIRTGYAVATSGCTFAANIAALGGAFSCWEGGSVFVESIFSGNFAASHGAVHCDGDTPLSLSCCDVYGNIGGNWTGCIADQEGINGNFSLDPLFCDTANGDFHISSASPCAPAQNSCGALVGALGIGCATAPITVIEPNPLPTAMANVMEPDKVNVRIYFGDFVDGHDIDDIDPNSLLVNDSIPAALFTHVLPNVNFYSSSVVGLCPTTGFIQGYGQLYGVVETTYTISGRFLDDVSFSLEGRVTLIAHRSGDVDGNQTVNISDIVYLVNYIFGAGPEPEVLTAADVDCSGFVNVSDVVYLIDYIFGGGPEPCAE
jgi:parallel beta-helix repeat protein